MKTCLHNSNLFITLSARCFSRPCWVFYINSEVEESEGHTDNKYKIKAMRHTILGLQ